MPGVPDSIPVVLFNVNPVGRAPLSTVYVIFVAGAIGVAEKVNVIATCDGYVPIEPAVVTHVGWLLIDLILESSVFYHLL